MNSYNFTIDPLNIDRLESEISDSQIVTALDHITSVGSSVDIFFKAELSSLDQIILSDIVAAHSGDPLPLSAIPVKIDGPTDSDDAPLLRHKITKTGWGLQCHSIEIESSKLGSLYDKKKDGTDYGYGSLKFYDADDVELTTQEDIDTDCVKTVLKWHPTEDYEIVGGEIWQQSIPTEVVRAWFYHEYSGHEFCTGGFNFQFLAANGKKGMDGRAPKLLPYMNGAGTAILTLIIRHSVGYKHKLMLVLELFKE